jgi:hypothetical protein
LVYLPYALRVPKFGEYYYLAWLGKSSVVCISLLLVMAFLALTPRKGRKQI